MDYVDRATALHDALVELFSRYPAVADRTEMERYHWNPTEPERAATTWRKRALQYASGGTPEDALNLARGTGVPQEELDALKALLYG